MNIRVIYSTEAFLSKNGGKAGKQLERSFTSIEKAKTASFPQGFSFALIPVEEGRHVYSSTLGWEFHKLS